LDGNLTLAGLKANPARETTDFSAIIVHTLMSTDGAIIKKSEDA